MDMAPWIDVLGEPVLASLLGLAVGLAFGAFAQQSRFCLRAAIVEVWRGDAGPKLAVWLVVFSIALLGTQFLLLSGQLQRDSVRQLATAGSMSGALIGGAMFGIGMILARGCASRLLVLSATGNMRALVTGLVLTLCAQASLTGALSPFREVIAGWWVVPATQRELLAAAPSGTALAIGIAILAIGMVFAWRSKLSWLMLAAAAGVGFAIVAGWYLTASLAASSFELVQVKSVSFTGPSADTLMALVYKSTPAWGFDLGLVPGVFIGSMMASLIFREFKIQQFNAGTGMTRYLIGALLMGFGSMLAAGCAVGAGVTGGSVMAVTAWVALMAMWFFAGLTDLVIDRPRETIEQANADNSSDGEMAHLPAHS